MSNDEMEWQENTKLAQYSLLTSYGECKEELIEIYTKLFNDTSSYYRVEAAEAILRCEQNIDLSSLYADNMKEYNLIELYGLTKKFPEIKLLPDSLLNFENYMEKASLAYVNDEEYYDSVEIELIGQEVDGNHTNMYYTAEIGYDGDEELIKIVILSSIENSEFQNTPFIIPDYNKVNTFYEYYEEGELEKAKLALKSYMEEN